MNLDKLNSPMRFVASVMAIVLATRGLLLPYLDRERFYRWQHNYEQYEVTILAHTSRTVTHVTQFIPKNKCQFADVSVATGRQVLPNGSEYVRRMSGRESLIGMALIPHRGPEWVSLDPYTQSLSGFNTSLPIEITFVNSFTCNGKPAFIQYDPIIIPALEETR